MKYHYLRCPACLQILAVGPRLMVRPDVDTDDWDDERECWFCNFEGTMPWTRCGGEGKRDTVFQRMETMN